MRIEVFRSDQINGRYSPVDDIIWVSEAATVKLQEDELRALIAHEMGHKRLLHGWRAAALEVTLMLGVSAGFFIELWSEQTAIGLAAGALLLALMHRIWLEFEADMWARRQTSARAVRGLLDAIAGWQYTSKIFTLRRLVARLAHRREAEQAV